MDSLKIEKRKGEHIDIILHKDVSHGKKTTSLEDVLIEGFEDIELNYSALPEISLEEVDVATEFLGKKFSAPLIVSGMVGGIERARQINKNIAKAVQEVGIGMGIGSQRPMLKNPEVKDTYFVRDVAPDVFLAGNIGVSQLKNYDISVIEKMLEDIQADALSIHINAAQEAVQLEGDTDFTVCLDAIDIVSRELSKPVYVKEVGHGFSYDVAKRLAKTNIKAIDVHGVGGTSWTAVESLRGNPEIGKTFWNFGIPTAVSIHACRKAFKGKIIASGGIRNWLDVVKSLVLGADMAGFAAPAIKADNVGGEKEVEKFLNRMIKETKIACYLLGCTNIKELKKKKPIITGKTKEWIEYLFN